MRALGCATRAGFTMAEVRSVRAGKAIVVAGHHHRYTRAFAGGENPGRMVRVDFMNVHDIRMKRGDCLLHFTHTWRRINAVDKRAEFTAQGACIIVAVVREYAYFMAALRKQLRGGARDVVGATSETVPIYELYDAHGVVLYSDFADP